MFMYCSYCGKENKDGSIYCLSCGNIIDSCDVFNINKEDYIDDEEKNEYKAALNIEYNVEELTNVKKIKLKGKSKPSYLNKTDGTVKKIRSNRNVYVDLIGNEIITLPKIATFSIIATVIMFFVWIIILSNAEVAYAEADAFLSALPYFISTILLFILSIFLIINVSNNPKDNKGAFMALRIGKDSKAKIMKLYQKNNKYYIIFRYLIGDEVFQTNQRIKKGTYDKLFYKEGQIIDIKKGSIGVLVEKK